MMPFMVPDAVPGNTSFQLILLVSAPLHCTDPLPMMAADVVLIVLATRESMMLVIVTILRAIRVFICILVMANTQSSWHIFFLSSKNNIHFCYIMY